MNANRSQPQRLRVSLNFGAGAPPLLLGECLWVASQEVSAFEWSAAALAAGYSLSPLHLPLRSGVHMAPAQPFGGLHGMLADSIPDGFGLRLMNQSLRQAGYNPSEVTPIQRLAWVGQRGVGALTYEPVLTGNEPSRALMDLTELGTHAAKADVENFKDIPASALHAGGSAQGARPKFWGAVSDDGLRVILGDELSTPPGFTPSLIKFAPTQGDRNEPFCEAACLQLAQLHGVSAARARLLHHPKGAALAVQRFDRLPQGARLFTQSLAALLHDDFRTPRLDYMHLVQVSARLRGPDEAERIYRQACFNVALSIRDDHSKNFVFCMDAQGQWALSPAFDLCPCDGPAGWHTMTVSDVGHHIQRSHLLAFADKLGLDPRTARDGIDQALSAANAFEALAISLGATKSGTKALVSKLKVIACALT